VLFSIIDEFTVPIYLNVIIVYSNTRTVEVASLVSFACSYPYGGITIYRNVYKYIHDILDFNTNIIGKKLLIFMYKLFFIIPILEIIRNVLLTD
jgi:hypothetical protein